MILIDYPDRDTLFASLANSLADELKAGLSTRDRVSLAVPGGSTPGPVFDALSEADLDWSRVDVLLTDERRVPSDHERSNERLIRARLLQNRAAAANFVRLVPNADDLTAQIEHARPHLPLTVLVLGMGADMHTASLFPGAPQLAAALDPAGPPLMLVDASEGLEPRITLTAPALTSARSTHVLITGDDKKTALDQASRETPETAPITLVLGGAQVHWAP